MCVCVRAQPLSLVNSMRPMGCSPPGSSVHGILHARILERVAVPSSRGSSRSRDRTRLSCIAGGFFTAHGILQARTLEWGEALTPSRISSGRAVTGNRSIASRGRLDLSQSCRWPDSSEISTHLLRNSFSKLSQETEACGVPTDAPRSLSSSVPRWAPGSSLSPGSGLILEFCVRYPLPSAPPAGQGVDTTFSCQIHSQESCGPAAALMTSFCVAPSRVQGHRGRLGSGTAIGIDHREP